MNPSASSLPVDLLSTWLPRAVDAHAIVAVTDAQGVIIYANDAFTAVSGYAREELIGKTHAILKSGVHGPGFYATLWSTIRSGKIWHGTFCNRAKDGHHYWVDSTLFPVPGPEGAPAFYLSLRTNVSALKVSEAAATALSERLALQASQLQASSAEWDRAVARGESALAAAVTGPAPDNAVADTAVRVARRVWRDRVDVIEVSVPLTDGRWFSLTRLVSRPDASTGAAR